ncbi:hypothetical protein N7462_004778 [Penicillium macrosclerotiorum]|uniref:uncharacterized protein n=1 Tax=Penicillium macrosclerotiorum TaxID=303699 RepID=UPI002548BC4D|nr:uncharacterized protein N7462_004778 [Penicillium macrosclerotiorum]KAJ5690386.1 hypothetical protein N7462_004778 [Penicillium macrosclerotiorum]
MFRSSEKPLADLESDKWSLIQAFCINAGGLALRSKDAWIYSVVTDEEMVGFVESGTLKPSDLSEQEVLWFLCNTFTRWGYHLEVSPLELATVAYIAIAILTYLIWWYTPKDISIPILAVLLPCDRETLEKNFLGKIDSYRWTHLQVPIKEESILDAITSSLAASIFVSGSTPKDGEVIRQKQINGAKFLSVISIFVYSFAALAYSGIHLAA